MRISVACTLTAACLASSPVQARTYDFPEFSDTSGLILVGDTAAVSTQDGVVLRLVPALGSQVGAATLRRRVGLRAGGAFTAAFQFRITGGTGDGFTFVVSRFRSKLGVQGGRYLGYRGDGHSVAVTFDTFQDAGDPGNNQVTVEHDGHSLRHARGSYGFPYGVAQCSAGQTGCLFNGDVWTGSISYDGQAMTVTLQDGSSAPTTIIDSYPINLTAYTGSPDVFVGFTAGTGAASENIDVLNFVLNTKP